MGELENINNKINELKKESANVWDKASESSIKFLNKINQETYDEVGSIWKQQTYKQFDFFIQDTFRDNYPDKRKSLEIIKEKFSEVCLRLKKSIDLIEKTEKELF